MKGDPDLIWATAWLYRLRRWFFDWWQRPLAAFTFGILDELYDDDWSWGDDHICIHGDYTMKVPMPWWVMALLRSRRRYRDERYYGPNEWRSLMQSRRGYRLLWWAVRKVRRLRWWP